MFINKKFYKIIDAQVKEILNFDPSRGNKPIYRNYNKTPTKIYYLSYLDLHDEVLPVLENILKDDGVLENLKTSESDYFLLLDHLLEGYSHTLKYVAEIFVKKLGIPGRKIHILSESHSFKENAREFFNPNDFPTFSTVMALEMLSKSRLGPRLKTPFNTPKETLTPRKRFLCLNNRGRDHRALFLSMLKVNGVLNNSYHSLTPSCSVNNSRIISNFHRLLNDVVVKKSPNYYKKINEWLSREGLGSLFNTLDTKSWVTGKNAWAPKDELIQYYNQTDISVITETQYFMNGMNKHDLMFTEKVFRPILLGHPFIVLSVPGYLEGLKQLGYRTFDNVFDESYDSIQEDIERMEAVATELERLNNLSNRKFAKLIRKTKPATSHNEIVLSKLQNARFFYDSSAIKRSS